MILIGHIKTHNTKSRCGNPSNTFTKPPKFSVPSFRQIFVWNLTMLGVRPTTMVQRNAFNHTTSTNISLSPYVYSSIVFVFYTLAKYVNVKTTTTRTKNNYRIFFVNYFLPGPRTQQSWKNWSGGKPVKQQRIINTWNIHLVSITRMIYHVFVRFWVPCFLLGTRYEEYAHSYPFSTYTTGEVGSWNAWVLLSGYGLFVGEAVS